MFLLGFISNDLLGFLISQSSFILPAAAIMVGLTLIAFMLYLFAFGSSPKIFLLDFACYKPPSSLACTKEMVIERLRLHGNFSDKSLELMKKLMKTSGLGEATYLSEGLLKEPLDMSTEATRKEAEMVVFGAVDELLGKTGVKGEEIGIVVVHSSIFNTVPSLASMIVNRYKLRENVLSYNMSGMGCSAGLLSIGLAKDLLKVHCNSYALVVTTEIITQGCYMGKDPSKLIGNCIFRMGGAAVLLSNRLSDCNDSKYQLIHTVHTNTASSDRSYNCIIQEKDHEGHVGITITKDLLVVASEIIKSNVATLAPLILPASERLLYLINYLIRYFHVASIEPHVPNVKRAVDHFFPHVGAKPILDKVARNLRMSEGQMEASRMTLYRFGNTSSSSVWYELAYAEAKGRIKRGDRVWQIAYGSGFKCSSAFWKAIRTVDREKMNPWSDVIDEFPVVDPHNTEIFPYAFELSKSK
ncbi:3-ketoacyl-CoA synthase 20-like [Vitis riparia]|uniref:3-ketoacyl-CoA synthase 20-like n=1 Tax=Vitis riparia TaxID=96939 RepID=UPI00155B0D70|nr:3-ketoacyl-CoA synthase 20-like [Vitis riparia]